MRIIYLALSMLFLNFERAYCPESLTAAELVSTQRTAHQQTEDLTLEVSAPKSTYAKGDAIEMDFILRNAGKTQQIVARRLSLGTRIMLEVLNPDGGKAKRCGRISDEIVVLKGDYKTLYPGESVKDRIKVSCDDAKGTAGYVFDRPGKYVIKASYRLSVPKEEYEKAFPKLDVILGPVWAKPITVEVQ